MSKHNCNCECPCEKLPICAKIVFILWILLFVAMVAYAVNAKAADTKTNKLIEEKERLEKRIEQIEKELENR